VNPTLKEMPNKFLDDDLDGNFDFTDTIIMGLKTLGADLEKSDDITNIFVFSKWRFAPLY
jgi:hypothetical protein